MTSSDHAEEGAGRRPSASPLVTVYTAAHDAADCIGAAIESCLGQTHDHVELIVVDDASTDDTVRVVEGYDDERLVLLRLPENAGPGAARNAALEVARGEWLAVMDADDVMHPDRLATLLRWSEEHPDAAIVVDDSVRWYPDRTPVAELLAAEVPDDPPARDVPAHEWLRRHLGGKPMFRRELLDRTGVRYPDFRAGQDTSFLIQLAVAADVPISWVHVPTYLYRYVEGSLSARTLRRLDEVERMLLDLRSRLGDDERVREAADVRLAALKRERLAASLTAARAERRWGDLARLAAGDPRGLVSLVRESVAVRLRRWWQSA